jgi:hypothetical protein
LNVAFACLSSCLWVVFNHSKRINNSLGPLILLLFPFLLSYYFYCFLG